MENQIDAGSNGEDSCNVFTAGKKVHTQVSDLTIKELCDRINKRKLDVQADFQRKYVWENKSELKSKLIESVFLEVPIPVIYTAETRDGKEVVVDGQQRLKTFVAFCKIDGFKLSKLKVLPELNRKGYADLTQELQDAVDSYTIRVVKILKDSPPNIKFEVFERLNRGSVKLNDQELRNCIYHGNFNDLLKRLVDSKDFLKIQNLDEPHERMKDVERVLRFFAFCDRGIQNYQSSLANFLSIYMDENREISDEEIRRKTELFNKCTELCRIVFGDITGRKWTKDEDGPNGSLSAFNEGILDAQIVGFMEYNKHDIVPKAQVIKDAFIDLVSRDERFIETTKGGTYSTKTTKKRMDIWFRKLRDILDYPTNDRRLYTFEEKKRLFEQKDGNICQLCKNRILDVDDAHVDHIERFVDGGKTTIKNAQLTHRYCNLEKG